MYKFGNKKIWIVFSVIIVIILVNIFCLLILNYYSISYASFIEVPLVYQYIGPLLLLSLFWIESYFVRAPEAFSLLPAPNFFGLIFIIIFNLLIIYIISIIIVKIYDGIKKLNK